MLVIIQAETPDSVYNRQVVAVIENPISNPNWQTLYQQWREENPEEDNVEEFGIFLENRGYSCSPFISTTVYPKDPHEPGT